MQMQTAFSLGAFLKRQRLALDPRTSRLGTYVRLPVRIGRSITQEEVAEAAGITRNWYALLELDAGRASAALASRLAHVFNLKAAERLTLIGLASPDIGVVLSGAGFERPAQPAPPLSIVGGSGTIARTLARARESFLLTGVVDARLRRRIVNSWLRSRAAKFDASMQVAPNAFSRDGEIDDLLAANERLLRAARVVLASLSDQLSGSGYIVILTDASGRVLEAWGDSTLLRRAGRLGLSTGGDFSENAIGTNAIGTAILERRPLQVVGSEHLCEGCQDLNCTAAPIRDPETLEIVGALDITGRHPLASVDLLGLALQCAFDIEEAIALL
jgi:transcriptional regulator with XRE-family HTH domain